jgi:hypothetical protein
MKCLECEQKKPVSCFQNDDYPIPLCDICQDLDKYHINLDVWDVDATTEEDVDFMNQLIKKYASGNTKEMEMESIGTIGLPNAGYLLLMKYKNECGNLAVDCSCLTDEEEDKLNEMRDEAGTGDFLDIQSLIWFVSNKKQFVDAVYKHIDPDSMDNFDNYFQTRYTLENKMFMCRDCIPCFEAGKDECRSCGFDMHRWDCEEDSEDEEDD